MTSLLKEECNTGTFSVVKTSTRFKVGMSISPS